MYGNVFYFGPAFRQRITMQQAQAIALRQVPGQVIHADLEMENGVLKYEIYILTPRNKVFEVEISARSGRVLSIEEENDWD